jgi:hypothetical protein
MRRNYLFIYPLNDKHQDYTDNTIPKRFIMVQKVVDHGLPQV